MFSINEKLDLILENWKGIEEYGAVPEKERIRKNNKKKFSGAVVLEFRWWLLVVWGGCATLSWEKIEREKWELLGQI
jgi:hypothetical protein